MNGQFEFPASRERRPSSPALSQASTVPDEETDDRYRLSRCDRRGQETSWLRDICETFSHMRRAIWLTLREYFHRVFVLTLEVPAFRGFSKALKHLLKTLTILENALVDLDELETDHEICVMIADIKGILKPILDRGSEILRIWTGRPDGLEPGTPLSAHGRRLRRCAIHEDNACIKDLGETVWEAEVEILCSVSPQRNVLNEAMRKRIDRRLNAVKGADLCKLTRRFRVF